MFDLFQIKDILPKEKQIEYFRALKTETDPDKIKFIENELFNSNIKLVFKIIKDGDFHSKIFEEDDFVSVGAEGLLKAIRNYDVDRIPNRAFGSFASKCIMNEILMVFRKYKNLKLEQSFEDPLLKNKEGEDIKIDSVLASKEDIVEEICEIDEMDSHRNFISNIIKKDKILTDREKKIIILRFGLLGQEKHSVNSISKILKITSSAVTNTGKKAMGKIKKEYNKTEQNNKSADK